MNRRSLVSAACVASVVATGILNGAPAYAGTGIVTPQCGATVTVSIALRHDLVDCPGDGIVVGADNVTVNLNGHTISGDGESNANGWDVGVRVVGHHHVTVTNGAIQRFGRGVLLDGSPGAVLSRLDIHRNINRGVMFDNGSAGGRLVASISADNGASGIAVVASDNVQVSGNRSLRNTGGGSGILLSASSNGTITGNILSNNDDGLSLGEGSNDNRLTGNAITDTEQGVGINFSDGNVVTHNRVAHTGGGVTLESADNTVITDNVILHSEAKYCDGCGIGIQIYGDNNVAARNFVLDSPRFGIEVDDFQDPGHTPITGTVLKDNIVTTSGLGIAIGPETDGGVLNTIIARNLVSGATGDGIQLVGPSNGLETSTVTGNIAFHNGALGINAIAGAGDGGGNIAFGNGNPAQCLNILCNRK